MSQEQADNKPEPSKSNKKGQNQAFKILDNFGRNLTQLASLGELDEAIGRENEIERLIQVLSRRKKNNPVLVGEPGVGKCFSVDTEITLRNDITGEEKIVSVKELLKTISNS